MSQNNPDPLHEDGGEQIPADAVNLPEPPSPEDAPSSEGAPTFEEAPTLEEAIAPQEVPPAPSVDDAGAPAEAADAPADDAETMFSTRRLARTRDDEEAAKGSAEGNAAGADDATGANDPDATQAFPPVAEHASEEPVAVGSPEDMDATRTLTPQPLAPGEQKRDLSGTSGPVRPSQLGAYTPIPDGNTEGFSEETSRDTVAASLDYKPVFPRILQWVVAILTPFVLLAGAVRLVASTGVMWLIYHVPGFPADQAGFTTKDRVLNGSYGVDYLNNFAGSKYLSQVQTENGPLFTANEVSHMADVKSLVQLCYLVGVIALVLLLISFIILRKTYPGGIRRGLFAGSIVTFVLVIAVAIVALLGWDEFFVGFHQFFFSHGNWQFAWDDSLIRLYPPMYWIYSAGLLGGLLLVGNLVLMLTTWPTRRRRERSREQMEEKRNGSDYVIEYDAFDER